MFRTHSVSAASLAAGLADSITASVANRGTARWVVCGALLVLGGLAVAPAAVAQGNPQLADMNSEALEAYQNLDIDAAKAKLEQAIGMAALGRGFSVPTGPQATCGHNRSCVTHSCVTDGATTIGTGRSRDRRGGP